MRSAISEIDERGFAVLRGAFPAAQIDAVHAAAAAFYDVAERADHPRFPRAYLYNPGNMATSIAALDDFGLADYQLLRTVANSRAAELLRYYKGDDVFCSLTHSRMRKSYPQNDPARPRPSTLAWHRDSDPNVGYFGAFILWVPFTPCNDDYVGLELRARDGTVSRPELAPGDALAFHDTLEHRTANCPTSTRNRYSCDMRFFCTADIPSRVHKKVAEDSLLSVRAFAEARW